MVEFDGGDDVGWVLGGQREVVRTFGDILDLSLVTKALGKAPLRGGVYVHCGCARLGDARRVKIGVGPARDDGSRVERVVSWFECDW